MNKRCGRCGKTKPLDDFYKNRSRRDKHAYWCRSCWSDYQRSRRRANPELYARQKESWKRWYEKPGNREKRTEANKEWKRRNRARTRYHGRKKTLKSKALSPEDYDWLLERQEGRCAICRRRTKRTLHVDHDHQTGKIRGLLCDNCNLGMGHFRDDASLIAKAMLYLNEAATREAIIVRQTSLGESTMQDLLRRIVSDPPGDPSQSGGAADSAK